MTNADIAEQVEKVTKQPIDRRRILLQDPVRRLGEYPVTVRLTNTAITFRQGHKVRILISSSSYPKYTPNRNEGGPMYGKPGGVVANNKVHYDTAHPSALLLSVAVR